jgi:hypothetical protein
MTQGTDVREQALSYVRHQAAKSIGDLCALMERTSADCARCLEGVSERQGSFKHDEEWSIKEALGHLLGSMDAVNEDIRRMAEGKEPRPMYGEGPTSGAHRPIAELRRALDDQWLETVRLVRSLSEERGRKPIRGHPTFGPLNGKEWIAFHRLHAMDHVRQMEKIKAQPGYPEA